MTKRVLFILTGGTISAQDSDHGLVAGTINQELTEILASSGLDFTYEAVNLLSIDSTNMQPENWLQMAQVIQDQYEPMMALLWCTGQIPWPTGRLLYLTWFKTAPNQLSLLGHKCPYQKLVMMV